MMKVFDRYSNGLIDIDKLPVQIDLGRFVNPQTNEDLTNRIINVGAERIIRQEILENDNKSLQGLFCQFYHFVNHAEKDCFEVKPIIQSIKSKLFLNDFETLLEEKLFHLEEIFHQPHYLLQRIIEKVNVSRAKRIPAKSYQNLASHTEDWLHKSIVNFKPHRILNEELDLLYDVYENQVTVALIERCLLYLNSRIKEVQDITEFLKDYSKILSDLNDSRGWHQKIERNYSLIGDVYEDQHYHQEINQSSILAKTQTGLYAMQRRLKALQSTSLYVEINKRVVRSIMSEGDVRPTNVIANHKHYRYVRELWRELNKEDRERSEKEMNGYEQEVIAGIRCYSKALIIYIIKNVMGYEVVGDYTAWEAINDFYCPISMKETKGVIYLTIGKNEISFVTVGNDSKENGDNIKRKGLYILSLGNSKREDRIISVSPYDADSVERVGRVIKEYILRDYLARIFAAYEYPQMLKDYVKYIDCPYIEFKPNYTYSYLGIPQNEVSDENAVRGLESDEQFKRRSRPDRNTIQEKMRDLVADINKHAESILSLLQCQNNYCHMGVHKQYAKQLGYLKCDCGFVLDSTDGHVLFKNKDEQFKDLTPADWGMDYVEFDYC